MYISIPFLLFPDLKENIWAWNIFQQFKVWAGEYYFPFKLL
jgi:hypothetical protein